MVEAVNRSLGTATPHSAPKNKREYGFVDALSDHTTRGLPDRRKERTIEE